MMEVTGNYWLYNFIIDVKNHSVVVSTTIESFTIANRPGHRFFEAKTKYFPCCSTSIDTLGDVRKVLRGALDVLCPQVVCDLNSEACFQQGAVAWVSGRSCSQQATLLGKTLPHHWNNLTRLSTKKIARPLANLKRSLCKNITDLDDISHHIVNTVLKSWSATAYCIGDLGWEVPILQPHQCIIEYTRTLEAFCSTLEVGQRVATLEFLIGCILIAGNKLPVALFRTKRAFDSEFVGTKYRRMKNRAAFACSIFDGLLKTWGACAYYIYHVFAATNEWFRRVRDLPDSSRNDVVQRVIADLEARGIPRGFQKDNMYNPEVELANSLQLEAKSTRGILIRSNLPLQTLTAYPQLYLPVKDLQKVMVYQESVQARRCGRIAKSQRMIADVINHNSDNRSDLFMGILHLSQAQNLLYQFDFPAARKECSRWHPPSDFLTACETDTLYDQVCCQGRILKGEGRFDQARECFTGCFKFAGTQDQRILVISHLSDICCELYSNRQSTQGDTYLRDTRAVLEQEICNFRKPSRPSKSLRRLLLSLLEIEIQQNHFDMAQLIILELLAMYHAIPKSDINDRLGHVRTLIARARISRQDKEQQWNAALLQNRDYNPLEEEVFTCGVIYLFICLARLEQNDIDGAAIAFKKANAVLQKKAPQFLIPGIGTYLFRAAKLGIYSRTRWIIDEPLYN